MQDESFANSALRDLRELGMQLVLDNFDAGYSWLSYIYKYTFYSLKIDQSNLYPIFTIKNRFFWFLCGNEVYTDSFFRQIAIKVLPDKHFTLHKQKLSHKVEKSQKPSI